MKARNAIAFGFTLMILVLAGMTLMALSGCVNPNVTAPVSDSNQNFSTSDGDVSVGADLGVYGLIGTVEPISVQLQNTTPGGTSFHAFVERPYLYINDTNLVRLNVQAAMYQPSHTTLMTSTTNIQLFTEVVDTASIVNTTVLVKVSTVDITAIGIGDMTALLCRLDSEVLGAVLRNEPLDFKTLATPQFDFCRFATPAISFESVEDAVAVMNQQEIGAFSKQQFTVKEDD